MTRAGEEECEMKYTAKFRTTPPPQPVLFSLCEEEPGGGRPEAFVEPRPQERVQRHTVEHITDLVRVAPMVQILDAPVPQTGEQLRDILSFFGALMPDPEQAIEVPKILLDDVPMRVAERDTQLGGTVGGSADEPGVRACGGRLEALFEARDPWYSLRVVEGARGGLQGSRAGQNSTEYLEQIVENPVPQVRREGGGGLQGSLPVQNSAPVVEQIVDIPARRGLPDFLPGQGSASSSSRLHGVADENFTVFFALSRSKKGAKLGSHSGSELLPRVEPIHAASL